jgi:hypothetical protein
MNRPVVYTHTTLERMAENLETYYSNYNVYRSIIFCTDDEETTQLATVLQRYNHTVCTLCDADRYDDRHILMRKMKDFHKTSYRIILISYPVMKHIVAELEVYVLPEQNLVAFGNFDETNEHDNASVKKIHNWLIDARTRGFITKTDCEIIFL